MSFTMRRTRSAAGTPHPRAIACPADLGLPAIATCWSEAELAFPADLCRPTTVGVARSQLQAAFVRQAVAATTARINACAASGDWAAGDDIDYLMLDRQLAFFAWYEAGTDVPAFVPAKRASPAAKRVSWSAEVDVVVEAVEPEAVDTAPASDVVPVAVPPAPTPAAVAVVVPAPVVVAPAPAPAPQPKRTPPPPPPTSTKPKQRPPVPPVSTKPAQYRRPAPVAAFAPPPAALLVSACA